jgi:hypothetical protein
MAKSAIDRPTKQKYLSTNMRICDMLDERYFCFLDLSWEIKNRPYLLASGDRGVVVKARSLHSCLLKGAGGVN